MPPDVKIDQTGDRKLRGELEDLRTRLEKIREKHAIEDERARLIAKVFMLLPDEELSLELVMRFSRVSNGQRPQTG